VPHSSPLYWRYFSRKKCGGFVCAKKQAVYNRLIERFDLKQCRIFAVAFGEKRPIPRFSSSVDISYLTIRNNAIETFLFDQRPRQRLRQRLRRVSKASASRQLCRRRC